MDKIDYKILNKELYAPKNEPTVIEVPVMNFIMVNGHGNPNEENGEYQKAVELLYALTYTIKMSRKMGSKNSDDFTDYVVPPLEGLWWLTDKNDMDFTKKNKYCWISMIRQPEFITQEEFMTAQKEVIKKKPDLDPSKARLETFQEGLCIQCMHIGPYDAEPATIAKIDEFMIQNGLVSDVGSSLSDGNIRRHHEIYLSDPRKANPSTMKTILRHPVRK
ncbi:MAG TPA: GyrI-like domain-containing protein [Mobilitalea sp.]|nr:GyrI-like domain-containing protein [Mobilitalea sp.]